MDEKSQEMLDFFRIKEILAGFTSFSGGRDLALGLTLGTDYESIVLALRQTAEARQLLALNRAFSLGTVIDVREKVRLASLEKILDPPGLLEIQQTLTSLHEVRRFLKSVASEFPLLWEIAREMVEMPQLEKDIADCLEPNGEIRDNASPALAGIRQQLQEIRTQILERLEGIIRSPRGRRILQEDIITEREGRYVILVKVEARHEIKGIVHDISNTGATVFVEPTATVGLGNALRELAIEERHEIERILRLLSAEVGAHREDIERNISLAARLDLILAKARYALKIKASEPTIMNPAENTRFLRLVEARHPLLGEKAVPFSLNLGKDFSVLIVTGPNTGGKTVTLKTIGLLSLMAQAGMPIPAAPESQLPIFDGIFADIGDEQSIEQTLSTFSWHMGNIVRIIRSATEKSLVLLDELGTSTDPAEGSALAKAILRHFLTIRSLTVATTHFSDLKAFAYATPGMENASLAFDPVTLAPTYRLTIGLPGGSNAMATAARLGLPENIIADARSMMLKGSQELEDLLASLAAEKQKIIRLEADLKKEKEEIARRHQELEEEIKRSREREQQWMLAARDAILQEAARLHREIRQAVAELRREKSAASLEAARQKLAAVRRELETPKWQPAMEAAGKTDDRPIAVGDTVRIKETGLTATVTAVLPESREVEVQSGRIKMRLGVENVAKVSPAPDTVPAMAVTTSPRKIPPQIDLRGRRAEEVEPALDAYLDEASRAGLTSVRIIHGIATGTVRGIVREILGRHPLVKSFRAGERGEGGDGVTIATL